MGWALELYRKHLFAHGGEINRAGVVYIFAGEAGVGLQEGAQVNDLVDNVTRMATTHIASATAILRLNQVIYSVLVVRHACTLTILQENPLELVFRWVGDVDLVGNTSQERFVYQV